MALIVNGLRGKKCKTLKPAEKGDKTHLNRTERAKSEHAETRCGGEKGATIIKLDGFIHFWYPRGYEWKNDRA